MRMENLKKKKSPSLHMLFWYLKYQEKLQMKPEVEKRTLDFDACPKAADTLL